MKVLIAQQSNKTIMDYIIDKCTEHEIRRERVLCIDLNIEDWLTFVGEVQSKAMDMSLFDTGFRFNGVIVRPDRKALDFIKYKAYGDQ